MQRLEVSGAVRLIYRSLGVKGLNWCKESIDITRKSQTGGRCSDNRECDLSPTTCVRKDET